MVLLNFGSPKYFALQQNLPSRMQRRGWTSTDRPILPPAVANDENRAGGSRKRDGRGGRACAPPGSGVCLELVEALVKRARIPAVMDLVTLDDVRTLLGYLPKEAGKVDVAARRG
jgi:hypothetical protein